MQQRADAGVLQGVLPELSSIPPAVPLPVLRLCAQAASCTRQRWQHCRCLRRPARHTMYELQTYSHNIMPPQGFNQLGDMDDPMDEW